METFETHSAEQTISLGVTFADRLGCGDCLALTGQLGAGKTVLVRGIAQGLGLDEPRTVASPTFVLVREYAASLTVYHVDLYRLEQAAAELGELGIEEMLADGVVLIEWADKAEESLPRPHWRIDIEITGKTDRRFTLKRVE